MKSFTLLILFAVLLSSCMQNEPKNPGIPENNMPADSVSGVDSLTPHQPVEENKVDTNKSRPAQ